MSRAYKSWLRGFLVNWYTGDEWTVIGDHRREINRMLPTIHNEYIYIKRTTTRIHKYNKKRYGLKSISDGRFYIIIPLSVINMMCTWSWISLQTRKTSVLLFIHSFLFLFFFSVSDFFLPVPGIRYGPCNHKYYCVGMKNIKIMEILIDDSFLKGIFIWLKSYHVAFNP